MDTNLYLKCHANEPTFSKNELPPLIFYAPFRSNIYDHLLQNLEDELGYAVGIVSSIFYVGSRSGQMYKNVSTCIIFSEKK